MLLDRGVDANELSRGHRREVDQINSTDTRALYQASLCGYDKILQVSFDESVSINGQGRCYGNALSAALRNGNARVVEMLLERSARAQGGYYGSNTLSAAFYTCNKEVVQMIFNKGFGNKTQVESDQGASRIVTASGSIIIVCLFICSV